MVRVLKTKCKHLTWFDDTLVHSQCFNNSQGFLNFLTPHNIAHSTAILTNSTYTNLQFVNQWNQCCINNICSPRGGCGE